MVQMHQLAVDFRIATSLDRVGHQHGQGTGIRHRGRLALVLALSLLVLAVEAVVAWFTGSLALLADAGHVLGDSAGIVMALAAISAAQRGGRPGSRRTFGYHRTEVLAAGLNGAGAPRPGRLDRGERHPPAG